MNQTAKLYDLDSYVREFDAEVLLCEPATGKYDGMYRLILDRTAFFPEGGGQAADTGLILNDDGTVRMKVADVHISDGVITHYVSFDVSGAQACTGSIPVPGDRVRGIIDFKTRFDRMQQHSGEHLLSGHVSRTYGFANVGFHLSDDLTTVDFDGTFSDEDIKSIEAAVNEAICSNTPVEIFYPSSDELENLEYRSKKELEGPVRIVRIGGYDTCACCAPHVAATGEIGSFKILSSEHFRGGTRMTIVCGMRALSAFTGYQDSVKTISQLLSVKPGEVAQGVAKLKDADKELKFDYIRIEKELFNEKVRLLVTQKDVYDTAAGTPLNEENRPHPFIFTERANPDNAREAANKLTEHFSGYCGVFTGNDTDGYSFIISSKDSDCTKLMSVMKDTLSASGGGKPSMIQGRVQASRAAIKERVTI